MKNNALVIGIVALVLGLGFGYALAAGKDADTNQGGSHVMPDGSAMHGQGSMTGMMHDMNAALVGKTGDAFDREFLAQMIIHHQGAVQMAEAARKDAEHDEIKDLAEDIIETQNDEIEKMQSWMKSWYE